MSDSDDPFGFDDDDRTVLKPRNVRSTDPARNSRNLPGLAIHSKNLPLLGGISPLEQAASKLLTLFVSMRESHHSAPDQLRKRLDLELENFKRTAHGILEEPKQVTEASYILCTVLDEAAMNTPWGHQSNWAQYNLLSSHHGEVMGGERFFTLLKRLGKEPDRNILLLELMYVCLALGYEGNYRIADKGRDTLQRIRTWLHDIIQQKRKVSSTALSMHWKGSDIKENKLPPMTSIWVGLACALAIASAAYIFLLFSLSSKTENVVSLFSSATAAPLQVSTVAPPIQPVVEIQNKLTLSEQLSAQIQNGQLTVLEELDHGIVRLVGDNLFASGSANVGDEAVAFIEETSQALNDYSGAIVVSGYSDNIPIRSARFPSNLALSKARAESVSSILSQNVKQTERITFEGRGSLDPIGDNTSVDGRRMNRRVEITVYY